MADPAVRVRSSPSTTARLEKGERGVGIATLVDIFVVFGLVEWLSDLIDIRKDGFGMALDAERMPRRSRSSISARTKRQRKGEAIDRRGSVLFRSGWSSILIGWPYFVCLSLWP